MAGVPRSVVDVGRPLANVNTTPLTMSGVAGAERFCEIQPGSSEIPPPVSTTLTATTAPADIGPLVAGLAVDRRPAIGTRIHETADPAPDCCHAASASALTR